MRQENMYQYLIISLYRKNIPKQRLRYSPSVEGTGGAVLVG